MVAMARAMMMDPKVLLLDEPSAACPPLLTDEAFVAVRAVNKTGVTVIMVEQNARRCRSVTAPACLIRGATPIPGYRACAC